MRTPVHARLRQGVEVIREHAAAQEDVLERWVLELIADDVVSLVAAHEALLAERLAGWSS